MEKKNSNNGFEYVDLGLPSGTLWATCNVGASKPTEYGLYFQWGDMKGYTAEQVGPGVGEKMFSLNDYKWFLSGSLEDCDPTFTKYASPAATLELEDDAAHIHMGGSWHMPTDEQIQELLDNTEATWTTLDNVCGMTFTSKNGKSIFIPAAGYAWDGSVRSSGGYGVVWSSLLSTGSVGNGQSLNFYSGGVDLDDYSRYNGFSVRGVIG